MKYLEESIKNNFAIIQQANISWYIKTIFIKEKNDALDFTKIRNFYSSKDTFKKMKKVSHILTPKAQWNCITELAYNGNMILTQVS